MTRGQETRLTIGNLKVGEKYEICVRCKFTDGLGEWGVRITFLKENPPSWMKRPESNADTKERFFADADKRF